MQCGTLRTKRSGSTAQAAMKMLLLPHPQNKSIKTDELPRRTRTWSPGRTRQARHEFRVLASAARLLRDIRA